MDLTSHFLKVAYKRKMAIIPYWAGGQGRRVRGFCTSISQLRTELYRMFGLQELDLYCISNQNLRPLVSNKHVLDALSKLPHGAYLAIKAMDPDIWTETRPYHARADAGWNEGAIVPMRSGGLRKSRARLYYL